MDRIEEIDREIAELKQRLDTVTGTQTEIYSRIVGYYRSLANWNRGKREEYEHRRTFEAPADPSRPTPRATQAVAAPRTRSVEADGEPATYELFVRKRCPNCPPMKQAVSGLGMPGTEIDVDTEAGMVRAVELEIYATPTVVFFDTESREVARTTSAAEVPGFANLAVV